MAIGTWVHNGTSGEANDSCRWIFAGVNCFLTSCSLHRSVEVFCKGQGGIEAQHLFCPLAWESCVTRATEPMSARMFAFIDKVSTPLAISFRKQSSGGTGCIIEVEHVLSLGGSQACHASGVVGTPISVRMSFTSEETVGERAQLAMLIDCHGTCLPELSLGLRHHDITQPILVSHLFPLERKHNPPRRKPTTSICQNVSDL